MFDMCFVEILRICGELAIEFCQPNFVRIMPIMLNT